MELEAVKDAIEARFPGEVGLRDLYDCELHIDTRLEDGSKEEVGVLFPASVNQWSQTELENYLDSLRVRLKGIGGGWIKLDENKSAGFPLSYGKYLVRVEQGDAVNGDTTIILWLRPNGWANANGSGYANSFPTRFLRCRRMGDL